MKTWPNERSGVDAGRASLFAFLRVRPGATHRERSAVDSHPQANPHGPEKAAVVATSAPQMAFTLLELMVVIVIISILGSLLLVCVGRVKQPAQEALCLNNLRQIGVGLKLYHDENRGRFPLRISMKGSVGTPPAGPESAADWWDFTFALGGQDVPSGPPAPQRPLAPYIKSAETFHCPADKGDTFSSRPYWSRYGCSYGYNAFGPRRSGDGVGSTGLANKNENSFSNPTSLVMMFERPAANVGMERPIVLWHRAKGSTALFLPQHYAEGHELVAPYLFLDGHVEVVVFKNGELPWESNRIVWR